MIIQSDDTLRIPVGYMQLKKENGSSLDAIQIGFLALIFQFKGLYRTNINDLSKSFDTTEFNIIKNLEYLKNCELIKVDNINDTLILTHGEKFAYIHKSAYEKRDSFAKKMKGSI